MFAHDVELLPNVGKFTQPSIVRLRRFNVEGFNDNMQLQISPGFSWSFFKKDTSNFTPQHKSHENTAVKLNSEERYRILSLRDWVDSEEFASTIFQKGKPFDPWDVPTQGDNNIAQDNIIKNKFFDGPMMFSHIENSLYFDIVAQVIAIKKDSDCIVLRCVDGSKPPLETFKTNSLYMETTLSQLTTAQLFDYYLDISVYDSHTLTALAVKFGDFVQFRNIHCYTPSSNTIPEVVLHKGHSFNRGMRILPDDHELIPPVKQRVNGLPLFSCSENILSDPHPYDPALPPTTECTYPDLPLTPLFDVLQSGKQKYLFKVRVFVDSYSPENFPSFILTICDSCGTFCVPSAAQCRSCDTLDLHPELFFTLQVRDHYDGISANLRCVAGNARQLLKINESSKLSMGELEVVEQLAGKWCDFHVVLGEQNTLVVMYTAIVDQMRTV